MMKELLPSIPPGENRGASSLNRRIEEASRNIRHVIFVMSGKGGVGKSSVAVNLAAGLAATGRRTGILDVDMHGPSVAKLLGLSEQLEADAQGRLIPAEAVPNLFAVSTDLLLADKSTAILWRGPKKAGAIKQFIGEVAWGDLDFLVIDSPPGTGDEHLTVLGLFPRALCLVVTTPQEVALADVRKALSFLKKIKVPVLGIVENMSGLSCPQCGHNIDLFSTGGGKALAKAEGVTFLGAIALDPAAVVAGDVGKPVVLIERETISGNDFKKLVRTVLDEVGQKSGLPKG